MPRLRRVPSPELKILSTASMQLVGVPSSKKIDVEAGLGHAMLEEPRFFVDRGKSSAFGPSSRNDISAKSSASSFTAGFARRDARNAGTWLSLKTACTLSSLISPIDSSKMNAADRLNSLWSKLTLLTND